MTKDPAMFPPPGLPPRKVVWFARTPPAVFPVILGGIGLVLALRRGLQALDLPLAAADLGAGLMLALWALAAFSYLAKMARRPSVILTDLKVLPGRVGLAAGTAGTLAAAALLVPFAPGLAKAVLYTGLGLHALLAGLTIVALTRLAPEGRAPNAGWHLSFVGFIIGGLAAMPLGLEGLARGLFWGTLPVAALIWAISLWQGTKGLPAAPLRPLLAIHLAPLALFSLVAGSLGMGGLSTGFAAAGVMLLVGLVAVGRWLVAAGFSPLWGAFTFPMAALASALLGLQGAFLATGLVVLAAAVVVVPVLLWRVLTLWPGGTLAARTNAAEA